MCNEEFNEQEEEKNNTITVNGSEEKIVQYSTGSNWVLVSGTENVYCYVDENEKQEFLLDLFYEKN